MVGGGIPPDVDASRVIGLAVGLVYVKSGDLPLKGARHGGVHAVFQSLSVEVLYRTHELCLFKCAVAYHHALFEGDGFFFEPEVGLGRCTYGQFLRDEAEELAYYDVPGLYGDRVFAVQVGGDTGAGAFNHHCGAGSRKPRCLLVDRAAEREAFLRGRGKRGDHPEAEDESCQYGLK